MASKLFFLFILLSLLSSSSLADDSPVTICKSTHDPSYCESVLPNSMANVHDSGRFSIRRALLQSPKFFDLVKRYLKTSSSLSTLAIRALEDCLSLTTRNIEFISNTFDVVNKTSDVLPSVRADDIQTLLSAILTNQETCLDGLATASSLSEDDDLLASLSNDTKLYSLCLSLFVKGWVPRNRITTDFPIKKHVQFQKGRIPMKMSPQTRAVFDWVVNRPRRKLLDAADEQVLINGIVVVSQDGTGNFTNITDAIRAAPNNSLATSGYFLIYVTAGVYQENVVVPVNKKYLLMIGDGINQTIITGNRSVGEGWTTYNSATFAVEATGFMGVNVTIRNIAGAINQQAVALRVVADLTTFYTCSFEGYQDTLYTHSLRQFYRECDVYGTIDFIFGNAAVVLQNCNIYARLPLKGQFNALTAQGRTDPNQNTGTSIHNCTIKATSSLTSGTFGTKSYLGRPWKEYSRTIVMQSYIDSLIDPTGWHIWSGEFALNTLYYAEYNNSGPGSNTSQRVTWTGYHVINNATDAVSFTVSNFLVGDQWLPQTGVPYTGGLI